MSNRAAILAAMGAFALLTGCAGVNLVEAGKPADLGDGVSVTPPTAWAKVATISGTPFLTIDGVGLGEVHYFTGIAPGSPIFPIPGVSKAEIGTYKANMLPNDVVDLLVASLGKAGNENVKTSDLAPTKFGSANGFKFNLSYVAKDGLEMKGEALIAQRNGKLDVLLFIAPTEYYYDHRLPDAEQLFGSVQVMG
jgi:hypothetical protein